MLLRTGTRTKLWRYWFK